MDDTLHDFTAQQATFVAEFAGSDNMSRACSAAGVSRGTGYAWMAKREFMEAVADMRSRAIASAWTSLSAGLQEAVDAVRGVLTSETTTTNAKLRAATIIIDQAQVLLEKQEIIDRIDKLEGMLDEI